MQTGFGDAGDRMAEQYMETMTNILLPVLEQAVVLAAEYSKACGRDTLLPEDMEYTMKLSQCQIEKLRRTMDKERLWNARLTKLERMLSVYMILYWPILMALKKKISYFLVDPWGQDQLVTYQAKINLELLF